MTLSEKYYCRSNKKNNFLLVLFVLAFVIILTFTKSRYYNSYEYSAQSQIAKWKLEINGEEVSSNKNTLDTEILLLNNEGIEYSVIRTGDTGYFEIEIDPSETEVSVEYEIVLSFVNETGTQSSMQFTEYSLNEVTTKTNIENNTINGTIGLNNYNALGSSDVRTYKVYWQWNGEDLDISANDSIVNANISVGQIIS